MSDDAKTHEADVGYAWGRLLHALETAGAHPDADARARAMDKIDRWRAVIEGMRSGALTVGSRTPVEGTPAWVTLEVAHGGFATGRFLAESALLDHERARLVALPDGASGSTEREKLNLFFLSDEGQRELVERVERGTYRVGVPEEGALAVVAWLLHRGHATEALELVAALRPLMHRLRFYPQPLEAPRSRTALVHVATAGEVAQRLRRTEPHARVAAMNETLAVWCPLEDRLVALWLDTVEGETPHLARAADGSLARRGDGQPITAGGWPCRRWPDDWTERRDAWLADFAAAIREEHRSESFARAKSTFAVLRDALERCPADSSALTGRDVGRIRSALAGVVSRRGAPGSPRHAKLRAEQAAVAARPLHAELASVLAARLGRCPAQEGLPSLEPIAGPVEAEEHVAAGTPIPEKYLDKAACALEGTPDELIERGVLRSAEALALVLPQLTAGVVAAGIPDAASRDLFAQIYAAFRRRRSLLLLHLEHQVRLDELPWIAALAPLRRAGVDAAQAARATLRDTVRTALLAFPQTIVPNRLVRELGALAKAAKLELPLVEEVAADIFMGTFTAKWSEAAERASALLRGTLYARYYDLPDDWRAQATHRVWKKSVDERFAELCATRAEEAGTEGGFVARNGSILEQSQILTTHNLAVLAEGLDLLEEVRDRAPALAARALAWVVRRHAQQPAPDFRNRLRMVKDTAYAWRQAIFFLSLSDAATQQRVVAELDLTKLPIEHRARFDAAVNGLRHAVDGGRFDRDGRAPGGRRFLGWARGQHWLVPR